MTSDSLFIAEKGGSHPMVEELKCSLICTFSGEGRRPANVKVLEVVGLQCIAEKGHVK